MISKVKELTVVMNTYTNTKRKKLKVDLGNKGGNNMLCLVLITKDTYSAGRGYYCATGKGIPQRGGNTVIIGKVWSGNVVSI